MTVPSMFSMKRAVAMMRAVRTAERIADSGGRALLAPLPGYGKAGRAGRGAISVTMG
jgi:hypothetical protein